ncbi:MAG: ATP synthase subunit I [Burkholderiaceae bacterium]
MGSVFESGRLRLRVILWRLVWIQMVCTVVAGALAGLFVGWSSGYSVVLGGLAVVLPASLGALRIIMAPSASPQDALRTQVSAQAIKWLITVLVFGAIFKLGRDVQAVWVFLGFGVVHLVYWLSLLRER